MRQDTNLKDVKEGKTWMMPLMRHTPCLSTTMCESSGCNDLSSCLTSSNAALWSLVSCSATILFDLLLLLMEEPRTARESPTLAISKVPFQITPTRQQDPTAAIKGFNEQVLLTSVRNASSVAENAALRLSSEMAPRSFDAPIKGEKG